MFVKDASLGNPAVSHFSLQLIGVNENLRSICFKMEKGSARAELMQEKGARAELMQEKEGEGLGLEQNRHRSVSERHRVKTMVCSEMIQFVQEMVC